MIQINSERPEDFKKAINSRVDYVFDNCAILNAWASLEIDEGLEKLIIEIEYVRKGD